MGTNKSKIVKAIKEIVENQPVESVIENFHVISENLMGTYFTEEISDSNFRVIVDIVGNKLEGKKKKEDIKSREEWVEEVIYIIENEKVETSDLLERALKLALGITVREDLSVDMFVYKLFYHLTELRLEDKLQGSLQKVQDGLTITEIKARFIKPISNKVFDSEVEKKIKLIIEGEISIKELDNIITEKVQQFNFGEF